MMTRPLDTRGVILVEYLIAFLPVFLLFATAFQTADLFASHLIMQRAASAAGRAASVVLPDDPSFYGGVGVGEFSGARKADIERAAQVVLAAAPRFWNRDSGEFTMNKLDVSVTVPSDESAPLVVTVRAEYRCYLAGILVCGASGTTNVSAEVRSPYHVADYCYEGYC